MGPYEDADILLVEDNVPYLGVCAKWLKKLESKDISHQIHQLFYELSGDG
jgi:hypothetical protein